MKEIIQLVMEICWLLFIKLEDSFNSIELPSQI